MRRSPKTPSLTELGTQPQRWSGHRIRIVAHVVRRFEDSHLSDGTGDWPGLNMELVRIWVCVRDRRGFLRAIAPAPARTPLWSLLRGLFRRASAALPLGRHGPLALTGDFHHRAEGGYGHMGGCRGLFTVTAARRPSPEETPWPGESDLAVYRRRLLERAGTPAAELARELEAVYGREGLRNRALVDVWLPPSGGEEPPPTAAASGAVLCELADEGLCRVLTARLRYLNATDGERRPLESLLVRVRGRLAGEGESG